MFKRMLDVALALLVLPLAVPFLLLAAAAVGLGPAGPVLYRSPRVGRGGQIFGMLRFRTVFGAGRWPFS